jgi:hypothetical protein
VYQQNYTQAAKGNTSTIWNGKESVSIGKSIGEWLDMYGRIVVKNNVSSL